MPNPIVLSPRNTTFDNGPVTDDFAVILVDATSRPAPRRSHPAQRMQPAAPIPAWGNAIAMSLDDATTQFRTAGEVRRHTTAARLGSAVERG